MAKRSKYVIVDKNQRTILIPPGLNDGTQSFAKWVFRCKELNPTEKFVLGLIHQYTVKSKTGFSFLTSPMMGEELGVSAKSIDRAVTRLLQLGYIEFELVVPEGSKSKTRKIRKMRTVTARTIRMNEVKDLICDPQVVQICDPQVVRNKSDQNLSESSIPVKLPTQEPICDGQVDRLNSSLNRDSKIQTSVSSLRPSARSVTSKDRPAIQSRVKLSFDKDRANAMLKRSRENERVGGMVYGLKSSLMELLRERNMDYDDRFAHELDKMLDIGENDLAEYLQTRFKWIKENIHLYNK